MGHLGVATLMDFIEQRLSEPEMSDCEGHIETCSVCKEMYLFWWHFRTTVAERLVDAPEQLIHRCIGIFPGAPPPDGFRQEIGRVVFDSFFQPAPVLAIRGESAARQIVIQMDGLDIHLRITGTDSKQNIQGQILPLVEGTSIEGARITLLALGQSTQSTTSNQLGVFGFSDVPKAPLVMSVELGSSRFTGLLSVAESKMEG